MLHVLGWRWKRTSPYRNLVAHVCRTQFLSQDPARCFSRKYSPKDNDDNDVIEAEIINDKTIDKDSGPHMTSSSWGMSDVGNFLSHGFNKAKEVIGMDEKSIRKRQARKKMDAEIDKALRGTGMMGAVLGKFIKMGTHMIAESAQQTSEDVAAIKECTEIVLLNDPRIRDLLRSCSEETVQCVPLSTAQSTVLGPDGQQHKQCIVNMQVLPLGTVAVECHLLDKSDSASRFGRVRFKSVLFKHDGVAAAGTKGSQPVWKIDYSSLQKSREINL